MVRHGHPTPLWIFEDFVATALTAESKTCSLQCRGWPPRQSRAAAFGSYRDSHGGQTHGVRLGNLFAGGEAVFAVEANGILDVGQDLLIGRPLRLASLSRGTKSDRAILIFFNNDRKLVRAHRRLRSVGSM